MTRTRLLGIDPGERRIGIAISDRARLIAQPLRVVDRRKSDAFAVISEICDVEDVETVVVGLPISLSGEEGASAVAARKFGEHLKSASGRNLVYWDERFTSVQAEHALLEAGMRREKRRDTRDMIAAALMLQGYLDSKASEES